MKQSIFILLFVLLSAVIGQDLEQTDWSGGPGEQGPFYWFDDTFWTSQSIDWSSQGSITLEAVWLQDENSVCEFAKSKDYPDTGTLESSLGWVPMATDWEIVWGNIEWTSNEPDCTSISFQLRTGMTPGDMGEWTDPITESGTYLGAILPDTILLLQYRAILNTTDPSVTPELEYVMIEGCYPGGIEDGQPGMQNSGILEVVSNPASVLSIRIHSPESGYFSLQLFDVSGRLHEKIFEGILESGDYDFYLDDLEDGLYFVRLDTPDGFKTEKAMILCH
jgi:hypothetical protein